MAKRSVSMPEPKAEFAEFFRSRLAGYECPRSILFVDARSWLTKRKLLRWAIDQALYLSEGTQLAR